MQMLEIVRFIKEVGISVGAFGLCAWMVVFIVKKLATSIDKMTNKMDVFTSRVRDEHNYSQEQHKNMMDQHSEMIKTLGRINGYKS